MFSLGLQLHLYMYITTAKQTYTYAVYVSQRANFEDPKYIMHIQASFVMRLQCAMLQA